MKLDLFQRAVLLALSIWLERQKDSEYCMAVGRVLRKATNNGELVGNLQDAIRLERGGLE